MERRWELALFVRFVCALQNGKDPLCLHPLLEGRRGYLVWMDDTHCAKIRLLDGSRARPSVELDRGCRVVTP